MKSRVVSLLILVVIIGILFFGCTKKETIEKPGETPAGTPSETAKTAPTEVPKLNDELAGLLKKLESVLADEVTLWHKDYVAFKDKATEYMKKNDENFLNAVFYLAEFGKGNDKVAANLLLATVGSEWEPHDAVQKRALVVVTTNADKDFRAGCWDLLGYQYEPVKITPELIKSFKESKNNEIRLEILEKIGSSESFFMKKMEEPLNSLCLEILGSKDESPEFKSAAIKIMKTTGKGKDEVIKAVEEQAKSADENVKKEAEDALKELKKGNK